MFYSFQDHINWVGGNIFQGLLIFRQRIWFPESLETSIFYFLQFVCFLSVLVVLLFVSDFSTLLNFVAGRWFFLSVILSLYNFQYASLQISFPFKPAI